LRKILKAQPLIQALIAPIVGFRAMISSVDFHPLPAFQSSRRGVQSALKIASDATMMRLEWDWNMVYEDYTHIIYVMYMP
jgi:hypothetical protein